MDDMTTPGAHPTLAFVFRSHAFSPFAVAEAAKGLCRIAWVVDTADPTTGAMPRMLARLGPVVDIAGLSMDEAARAVASLRPDAIMTQSDAMITRTAEIASRNDLRFVTPQTARLLTDKYAQRDALRSAGLPAPGSWTLRSTTTEAEWQRVEREAVFPGVVKPRHGGASVDTLPVASTEEAKAIITDSEMITRGGDREWVLEEYIPDADEPVGGRGFAGFVSVESAVSRGRITHLAVTGRTPFAKPFRETGMFIPSALDDAVVDDVLDTATRAAEALGVDVGCLHTEIKLTPSGPVVMEVNGRIGGGVPEMVEASAGVRMLEIATRIALGEPVPVQAMPPTAAVGYYLQVQAPDHIHRVNRVVGLEELRRSPGVSDVSLNRGPGRNVDWRDGSDGDVFSVKGAVADHEELRGLIGRVSALVTIEGE